MSNVILALRFDTKKYESNGWHEALFFGDVSALVIRFRLLFLKPTEKERKMSSYRDLQAQIEQLQKKAEEARKKEIDQVVAEIKSKLDEYGLTIDDLQNTPKKRGARKAGASTVAPKYRNEATGETWSGRGKPPKWIAGKDKSKFLIG